MVKQKDKRLILMLKELVTKMAGKGAEPIVDILFNKSNVNEFNIADKMKLTINQARNILYRISNYGILDSTRKKEKKRKGWYTYFWTLNVVKALEVYSRIKMKELELLEQVLKSHKIKQFYICNQDKIEMSEETAMQHSFMCPECGLLLQPIAKDKKLKEINLKIENVRNTLQAIKEELELRAPKIVIKVKKIKKKKDKGKKKTKQKKIKKNKK
ncbi:MAG: hypothetical protein N3G19_02190 [Candidatus Pacearchaeota archaeon]|nr:hypothetical protein [Candidatus Pacearchaeota archaeon]